MTQDALLTPQTLSALAAVTCRASRVGIDAEVRRHRAQLIHVERRQRLVVDNDLVRVSVREGQG